MTYLGEQRELIERFVLGFFVFWLDGIGKSFPVQDTQTTSATGPHYDAMRFHNTRITLPPSARGSERERDLHSTIMRPADEADDAFCTDPRLNFTL